MVDTVNTEVYDGARNYQIKMTCLSDGTGVSNLLVVDPTTMTPNPGVHLKLKRCRYSVNTMLVQLQWVATTPVDLVYLSPGDDILDFSKEYAGGWPNNAGVGSTGGVQMNMVGQAPNSAFLIVLEFIKGV